MSQPHPRSRPTPFDLVFEPLAQTTFPTIRAALNLDGHDPHDRDAFLMIREVVALLRELRPDEGLGEGIDQLAALIHHAYLYWDGGRITFEISSDRLSELLGTPDAPAHQSGEQRAAYYARVPERRIWAQVVSGQSPEPLDGCFVHSLPDRLGLRVLGVFGVYFERPGFSVVEVSGPRPVALARADGSGLFQPVLPGGEAAGLFSVIGEEELLDLGWRTRELAPGTAEAIRWRA
jgi:hypothetical protein